MSKIFIVQTKAHAELFRDYSFFATEFSLFKEISNAVYSYERFKDVFKIGNQLVLYNVYEGFIEAFGTIRQNISPLTEKQLEEAIHNYNFLVYPVRVGWHNMRINVKDIRCYIQWHQLEQEGFYEITAERLTQFLTMSEDI